MTFKQMIEVLEAAEAGKALQFYEDGIWRDPVEGYELGSPNFTKAWRIKPEPREWPAYVTSEGELRSRSDCYTGDRVVEVAAWKEIKVREVLE